MFNPVDQFRDWLEARGMRLTEERSIIVRAIFSMKAPIRIDAVVKLLTQPGLERRVSRATIYRTFGHLEDAGILTCETRGVDPVYSWFGLSLNPALCASEHAQLISGRCPWCGALIIDGKRLDD